MKTLPSRASRAPQSSSCQSIVRRREPRSCGRCSMARRSWPAGSKSAFKKLSLATTTSLETAANAMGATPSQRPKKRHCASLRRRKQRAMTGTPKVRARIQALGCRGKLLYHRLLTQPRSLREAPKTAPIRPGMPAGGANYRPRQLTRPARPSHRSRRSSSSCCGAKRRRQLVLLAQHRRESRDSTPTTLRRAAVTPLGPVLE